MRILILVTTQLAEAFALLIIMNNYKAWLHEEKMKHQEKLITEYEIDTYDLRESIVDHWLKDLEFKRTETNTIE